MLINYLINILAQWYHEYDKNKYEIYIVDCLNVCQYICFELALLIGIVFFPWNNDIGFLEIIENK